MKEEFFSYLLGDLTVAKLLANLVFVVIGISLSLLLHAKQRKVDSAKSPQKFSWKYLFRDNWKRLLTSLIVGFIFLRFSEQFGLSASAFVSLIVGFSIDKAIEFLKSKLNFLQATKK